MVVRSMGREKANRSSVILSRRPTQRLGRSCTSLPNVRLYPLALKALIGVLFFRDGAHSSLAVPTTCQLVPLVTGGRCCLPKESGPTRRREDRPLSSVLMASIRSSRLMTGPLQYRFAFYRINWQRSGRMCQARSGQGYWSVQLQQGGIVRRSFPVIVSVETSRDDMEADGRIRMCDELEKHGLKLASNQVEFSLLRKLPETSGLLAEMEKRDIRLLACKFRRSILSIVDL